MGYFLRTVANHDDLNDRGLPAIFPSSIQARDATVSDGTISRPTGS